MEANPPNPIRMYGHARCPAVPPVRGMLNRAGVPYVYINIHNDPAAAALVRQINHGNESVPTLIFPDESTLTEPTTRQLRERLAQFGYRIPWTARLIGHGWKILIVAGVAFAIIRALGWL
ncbi:glutaredoxin domain-containing protein [Herpetosiphon geysericola]|uniref:glutaredoxin domain-containing protein n=1 Tax=Herpetosiphon geysericola TaxID=70996 RepID=UPI0009F9FCC4|nr:glutaredoxin domain-containing protein [Herpetosiphon geysericola]